jgi:hypothetical protein
MTAMTQVVIDWITSLGWNGTQELGYPLFPGPEILIEPDKAVFITGTGGPGYQTEEGSIDAWQFQARVRGTTDDAYGPEAAALLLDQLIFAAPLPVVVDGVPIQNAHRAASPPVPLPFDPADRRHEFTCSYIVLAGV